MSILRLVQVGAACAQAAVDSANPPPGGELDLDAAVMRAGVLSFLRMHASRVEALGSDRDLVDAWRAWLEVATELYTRGGDGPVPDYMRKAALLEAELQLAIGRANGKLPVAQPVAA